MSYSIINKVTGMGTRNNCFRLCPIAKLVNLMRFCRCEEFYLHSAESLSFFIFSCEMEVVLQFCEDILDW